MVHNHLDWLNNLKKVWETKDFQLLEKILSNKIDYFEHPFYPPLTNKDAIVTQWKKDLSNQKDICLNFNILIENENECIAHWSVTFIRMDIKKEVALDGIFLFKLDRFRKCCYFKQWWVEKK